MFDSASFNIEYVFRCYLMRVLVVLRQPHVCKDLVHSWRALTGGIYTYHLVTDEYILVGEGHVLDRRSLDDGNAHDFVLTSLRSGW